VFVLDASTSVTEPNFEVMKDFVKFFLVHARVDEGDVRVGLISFSDSETVHFHLDLYARSKGQLLDAVQSVPWIHGNTNTADALRTMRTVMFSRQNGDRPDADNVAIVLTDGVSNIHQFRTIPEADECRQAGIHIYAIGIGLAQDLAELDGIANKPSEQNRFTVDEFSQLNTLRDRVVTALCKSRSL